MFEFTGNICTGKIIYKDTYDNVNKSMNKSKIKYLYYNKLIKQKYILKFLLILSKTYILSDYVKICVGIDMPLLAEYKIKNVGYIRFYLASLV